MSSRFPGRAPGSEAILRRLDGLETSKKSAFLEKLVETAEGRRALEEAKAVTDAMKRRFGTSDLRNEDLVKLTKGQVANVDMARADAVVGIVHRAKTAGVSRQQDLVRRQSKGLGLTM